MGAANSSITCRPRQRHYFCCTRTYPSWGGASHVYGSTMRQESVFSQLRRQWRRSLLLFLPKVGYIIIPIDTYSWLDNALGVLSQYIVVHSVFYFICFIMLFDDPLVLMVYIVYLILFFVLWNILIYIMCILL